MGRGDKKITYQAPFQESFQILLQAHSCCPHLDSRCLIYHRQVCYPREGGPRMTESVMSAVTKRPKGIEEQSRRAETQTKFIDPVEPTCDLSSSLMVHQSPSHLQQLTTQVSSIIIKILPHRSVHATTCKLASLKSFLDRHELSLSTS